MLEETGNEDATEFGVMLLRALQHLTRERCGRSLSKRLLLYNIQDSLFGTSGAVSTTCPSALINNLMCV